MRFVAGIDERGQPIDIRDPLSDRLLRIGRDNGLSAEDLASAYLGVKEVFGDDLPGNPRFSRPVTRALARLMERGAKRTVLEWADASF
jgi:fructuronate reductase